MKVFYFIFLLNISTIHGKYFKCNKNLSCGCASNNVEINARIINGEEAIPYSWSMIVSIRYDFFHDGNSLRHACSGTILSNSYILTSVNCLQEVSHNIQLANVTIAAGIHRRSQPIQIIRKIDDIIIHPNWTNVWNSDYDIALLHLTEPLDFKINSLITRTCLSKQYPSNNTTLAVVGWGRTSINEDDSDILRQIIVSSIDSNNTKCTNQITNPIRQFCTGLYKDDSG